MITATRISGMLQTCFFLKETNLCTSFSIQTYKKLKWPQCQKKQVVRNEWWLSYAFGVMNSQIYTLLLTVHHSWHHAPRLTPSCPKSCLTAQQTASAPQSPETSLLFSFAFLKPTFIPNIITIANITIQTELPIIKMICLCEKNILNNFFVNLIIHLNWNLSFFFFFSNWFFHFHWIWF